MIKMNEGEKIHKEVRRHWFVLASEAIVLFLLVLVPLFILAALPQALNLGNTFWIILFFTCLWWLILCIIFSIIWTNYYLDVWIITNQRLIDIEQHGLFSREVSEFRIERIQDVTVSVHGLLATMLKFGNVDVQTAGESSSRFVIRSAPHPYEVKDIILQLQNETLKNLKENQA